MLTLAVDLPFPSRRQRQTALPFAIEDQLADPIADLHFALGTELSPRRHLVGVVRRSRMDAWQGLLAEAGLDASILVPDALTLPMPEAGAWAVRIEGDRALARTDLGAGFALPVSDLATAWEAAGRPRLIALGDPLPDLMREGVIESGVGPANSPDLVIPPLDLRQGPYASVIARAPGGWERVAMIASVALLAHLVILGVDTLLLNGMAERREAEARALLVQVAPQIPANTPDVLAAAEQVLPSSAQAGRPFTRLMARASQALAGSGGAALTALDYAPESGLTVQTVVPDAAALNARVAALQAAGLGASGRPAGADQAAAASGLSAALVISSDPTRP